MTTLAERIAVEMEIHAAIGTTTRAKIEAIDALLSSEQENSREKIAVALFSYDYPNDNWDRLDAGRGSYNQDRYRAKASAVLIAVPYLGTPHTSQ